MMLEVAGLEAFYGEQQALFGVGFDLDAGHVRTLLGGQWRRQDDGAARALRHGANRAATSASTARSITGWATEDIVRLGVAHVPEGRGTFVRLTVEENLQLGAMTRRDHAANRRGYRADLSPFPAPQGAPHAAGRACSPAASSRCSRSAGR